MPVAKYCSPLRSDQSTIPRAAPIKVSVVTVVKPPIFSGRPYLNLTFLPKNHLPSAPYSVSCWSIPGAIGTFTKVI